MDTKPAQNTAPDRQDAPRRTMPLAVGEIVGKAETATLRLGTQRIYQFRMRHPFLYGLAAFILGGLLVVVFAGSTWLRYTYLSPDMASAMHELIGGGIAGGVVMVVLAFAYSGSIRPTINPMRAGRMTAAGE